MSNNSSNKYKRPKLKTTATTNPEAPKTVNKRDEDRSECPEHVCPLQAKDSEWVDILQTSIADAPAPSSSSVGDDEAILQLVDCEDGPETKPIAVMFPGLLDRDPQTLEGMLTKAMSTTEVTKHLVDLGEKADFTCMKRSTKLIPRDKQWLESVAEIRSLESDYSSSSFSSEYEADLDSVEDIDNVTRNNMKYRTRETRRVLQSTSAHESVVDHEWECQENDAQSSCGATRIRDQTGLKIEDSTHMMDEVESNKK